VMYNAQIRGFSGVTVAIANTSGTINIDCNAGHYQSIYMAGNISLGFDSNTWPTAGTAGMIRTQITVDQAGRTMALPVAVSNGVTGIQGFSSNVITFAQSGTYEFGFLTTTGGSNITIFDLNRPLSYYTNDVTMLGNLSVSGDIVGNVTLTDISVGNVTASGNITGGNILGGANVNATTHTGTTVSVSGNITGGNVLSGAVVSAVGAATILSGTAVPAGGTAGAGYKFSSVANLGVFFGSGAPTLSAAKGSLYLRTDGSTTNNRMYVNTDGSTAWTAVTTAA